MESPRATRRRTIGEWLDDRNHSKVARALRVDQTTVSGWVRGETVPSGPALLALARYLEITAEQIILPEIEMLPERYGKRPHRQRLAYQGNLTPALTASPAEVEPEPEALEREAS